MAIISAGRGITSVVFFGKPKKPKSEKVVQRNSSITKRKNV